MNTSQGGWGGFLDSTVSHQGECSQDTGPDMSDQLVIEHLEFQGHCGASEAERLIAQPIAVDLVLDYPPDGVAKAARSDDFTQVIDYATVAERTVQIGTSRSCQLLETLADHLLAMLFREFPVERVQLWVRKVGSVVKQVEGSVGVRVDRTRAVQLPDPPPSRFLIDHLHLLPKGSALDIAAGSGRNALYLAGQGFTVHGIDRDESALAQLERAAKERGLRNVSTTRLDLERDPDNPPELAQEVYDVVVVFFYLYRPLFPALLRALKPGGMLMYETFLIDNHLRHQHPRRREFCLEHNELLELITGLRVLRYEEGEHEAGPSSGRTFTARLIAEKERAGGSN